MWHIIFRVFHYVCKHILFAGTLTLTITWRFVIHWCIDGASRAIIYVKVANNNRADTVLDFLKLGVESFNLPSRVGGDRGMENVDVANHNIASHGPDRGSFIVGQSVHNQRIERMWGESNRVVAHKFKTLSRGKELAEILCPTSKVDMFALHYIYMSRVQRSLNEFQHQPNFHSPSSMGYISPPALWSEGVMSNPVLLDEMCDSSHLGTYLRWHPGVKGWCLFQYCWIKCVIRHI